jgi:hypothetical protein
MLTINKQDLIAQIVNNTSGATISTDELFTIIGDLSLTNGKENLTQDPLFVARQRGIEARQKLFFHGGQPLKSEEVGKLLNISRQAVDKRRNQNKLLAVYRGKKKCYYYPIWQFKYEGVLPGWEKVLAALADISPWGKMIFMLTEDRRLRNQSPLEALQKGRIAEVIAAAKAYGQQSAA